MLPASPTQPTVMPSWSGSIEERSAISYQLSASSKNLALKTNTETQFLAKKKKNNPVFPLRPLRENVFSPRRGYNAAVQPKAPAQGQSPSNFTLHTSFFSPPSGAACWTMTPCLT